MSAHLGHGASDASAEILEAGDAAPGATEWEDALIKHGIVQARTVQESQDERHARLAEDEQSRDTLSHASLEELDELLDGADDADERALQQYRAQRIAAIKETKARERFGTVTDIRADEFRREVTDASQSAPVVALLYTPGLAACEIALAVLPSVARRHPDVKFVRIVGSDAIANYPERLTPTLLVYKQSDIAAQLVGAAQCGGNAQQFERALEQAGAFQAKNNPAVTSTPRQSAIRRSARDDTDSEDEDDD